MSQDQAVTAEEEPRRGGRVRKQVERFEPEGGAKKRQKLASDEEDEEGEPSVSRSKQQRAERGAGKDDEAGSGESEEEASSEEETPRKRRPRMSETTNEQARSRRRSGNQPNPAGPVDGSDDERRSTVRKTKKTAKKARKSGGKGKATAGGDAEEKADCPLFNALNSADIALQPVIEEWVETYQSAANDETSERAAMYELISCIVRCCGVTADVEEDETLDVDGVPDAVERIQDESLKTSAAVYPLISKTKEGRTLRANLDIFVSHLVKTIGLTPMMYETDRTTAHSAPIMTLVISWLHTMSDSPLRSMRHTCTRLSLKVCTALCDVAAAVSSELSLRQRQRDAEAKKNAQGPAGRKRLADLEAKCGESQTKKAVLDEMMKKTLDTVFVHRVRDIAAPIRTDCQRELGEWFKKYGDYFIGSQIMSYVMKGCNDPDAKVRLETVKAIPSLVHNEANSSRAQSHLLRLIPRIVDLAIHDIDVNVRVNALHLLGRLEKNGAFDEDTDQRGSIATLIYASEPKIRKAAAAFFTSVWETKVEELKAAPGKKGNKKKKAVGDEELEQRIRYKALAAILLQNARAVEPEASLDQPRVAARASVAVEALWDEVEELQNWQDLTEYLLLDHNGGSGDGLLVEEEEGMLLGVLAAAVKHDERDDEDEQDEQTKALIGILPRMFTKYQADPDRLLTVLALAEMIKLDVYQDLRKIKAYETLWDDVAKLFLNFTTPNILAAATKVVKHFCACSALATQNRSKLGELQESVFASLRDAINGEEVYSMLMDEDRLMKLEAVLLRISLLSMSHDITVVMEDKEGGQSSGWEIVCAFAERGEVGYKEEAKLVEYALQVMFLHITWLYKGLLSDGADGDKVVALEEKRTHVKDAYYKLALAERTSSAGAVRKQAFVAYLNLHMLFAKKNEPQLSAVKVAPLEVEDEAQHRLEGVFASVAERYASDLADEREHRDDDAEADEPEQAQQEMVFLKVASAFVAAVRCRVLDVDHAKEPLAHFGRFGPAYDAVCKMLVDVLRDDGMFNGEATTVQHVCGTALQSSFDYYLETNEEEPAGSIGLSKLISSAFTLYGSQFSIIKQIHPSDVADLHTSAIDYLAKKLAGAVKAEKSAKTKPAKERHQKKLAQTLTYFKPLVNLLAPVTPRDAARLQRHLEDKVEESGVRIGTSKIWEGYRQYEKKLLSLVARAAAQDGGSEREDHGERAIGASAARGLALGSGADSTPTRAGKRKHVDEADDTMDVIDGADEPSFDLDLDEGGEGEVGGGVDDSLRLDLEGDGGEMDLDLELELPSTADQPAPRSRSASQEPGLKRRKTVRKL